MSSRILTSLVALLASASFFGGEAFATTFNGTAYYTDYVSHAVSSVTYSYDDSTHTFTTGTPTLITTVPGADGIVFAPNGNLLIGGQNTNQVYNVLPSNGTFTSASSSTASFHLTLAPNGQSVYTSAFGGPLVNIPLSNFGTANAPTVTNVTGGDTGITQLAFVPGGKTFYDISNPNCCGNVGTINPTTGVTTRLASSVTAAHGIVYDPYSHLVDLFGDGYVATIDPSTETVSSSVFINGANFDQGAPDGFGHALIAGGGGLTFIDYEGTSILTPNYTTFVGGFGNIDDIAPLSGIGSQTGNTPIPAALPLFASGLGGLVLFARRRKRKASAALASA